MNGIGKSGYWRVIMNEEKPKKKKNLGKIFEQNIKKSVDENSMYYYRLPDSPSSFNQDSSAVRFTLNTPYDMYIFFNRYLFTFELKSTKANSIPFDREKGDKKSIKYNQIAGLLKVSEYTHTRAGFLLDFRTSGITYYLSIEKFLIFTENNDKKSINEKDIIRLRPVILHKKKLQVNYRYDITKLLNRLIQKEQNNEQ